LKKILLIEDDPVLNKNIREALEAEGMQVVFIFDGLLAERVLKSSEFNCIVLDINLPGKTGYDLCNEFRLYNTTTPVLMLTAFDELEDKVKGYDSGADDYLTKPFYMRELILRINALIKLSESNSSNKNEVTSINVSDIVINLKNKTVKRQEKTIDLTPREYQILLKLIQSKAEVISKKELIREIWGTTAETNTNTVEVYINFLRNKIDKPFGKESIKTKVGYGYYFDEKA
jgi:DNA-binding response OmpR family regulator